MKKIFTSKIYYFFFIILFLIGIAIILPVTKSFKLFTATSVEKISDYLQDSVGISISYESFSPSILSKLSLKNVAVFNEKNEQIGSLNSVKLNYKIFKILKGDFQQGITSVVFDGINLDIKKVVELIQNQTNNIQNDSKKEVNFSLQEIRRYFPYKCYFNNIILFYNDAKFDASLKFNKISLNSDSISDFLVIDFFSKFNVILKNQNDVEKNIQINGDIDFSGRVKNDFSDANMYLTFSNITDGNINVNQINLYAGYASNVFELRTVQSVIPINFNLLLNLLDKSLKVSLQTENLRPLEVFSTNYNKSQLEKYKNISFTSFSNLSYNLSDNKMTYDSEGSINVPKESLYDGFDVFYSLVGNEKNISLNSFEVSGQNCQGNIQAEYNFDKMQLYGMANIPFVKLPNGKLISTELFFDPLEAGFMIFAPQIFIGDKSLTALQFNFIPQKNSSTYDFTFEVSDYSHLEEDEPGVIKLNGSFLEKSKYVQANASINSTFVDSIAEFVFEFMNESEVENFKNIIPSLNPYMISGDIYFSTDFNSFSYNVPYLVAANTKEENQVVMLSVNGNDESLQIDNFSLIFNKIAFECAATLETPNKKDLLFTLDLKSGAVPYHFSGSKSENVVTVSGDYDFFAMFDWSNINSKELSASLSFEGLPIVFDDYSLLFTTNVFANYDSLNGPVVNVLNFGAELSSHLNNLNPKFQCSGNITKYGAQFNNVSYTDSYSLLDGYANVMYNSNGTVFDSVGVQLNLNNPTNEESIVLDAKFTNPDLQTITLQNILDAMYMDIQLQLNKINLNRVAISKHESNQLSGSIYAGGAIKHPYIVLNVETLKMLFASNFMEAKGVVTVEDRFVSTESFEVDFSSFKFSNIKLNASLDTFTAHGETVLQSEFDGLEMNFPLYLDISETVMPKRGFIPESFKVDFNIKDTYGPFLLKPITLSLSAVFANDMLALFSNDNSNISGTLSTKGSLDLSINATDYLKAKVNGSVGIKDVDLKITDLNLNLKNVLSYLNVGHIIQVENGNIEGYVNLEKSFSDPYLIGSAKIENPSFKLPMFCKDLITTNKLLATITKDEIKFIPTIFKVKNKEKVSADAVIYLNKWSLDHIEASIKTLEKEVVKGGLDLPEFKAWGEAEFDLGIYFENNVLEVDGFVFGENVELSSGMSQLTGLNMKRPGSKTPMKVVANVDVNLGTHTKVNFDPLLRCVLAPNTKLKVIVDQQVDFYQILGDVNIRSGDIAYLNRNFYIKTGKVIFNPDDVINPIITITAETREKDENGESVRIILTAENQYLQSLNPKFSSVPAKSEAELRTLLGEIVIADSNTASNFLFAAGDYAIQSAVFRKMENKLRDFMNFDIFSLRTNILQNTLNLGINNSQDYSKLTPATLLDNTTLYIGKYLTSTIYFDAMLHVSLEDKLMNNFNGVGTLIFQPEIGLELESPFLNVRWNLAPNINALMKKQFVPQTSVTLSWKLAF